MSFQPGDRVEAQFQGGAQWYAGTISRKTATGYDVDYDDGDKEQNVAVTLIRSQVSDAVKALQDKAEGTPKKPITLKRQDSAEATSALLASAQKIKEDSLETSAETLANLRAAASESEAEAGLKAMNGLLSLIHI